MFESSSTIHLIRHRIRFVIKWFVTIDKQISSTLSNCIPDDRVAGILIPEFIEE